MNRRSSLLNELRIDREESDDDSSRVRWWSWVVGCSLLLGGGSVGLLVTKDTRTAEPPIVNASAAAPVPAPAPESRRRSSAALDATGYVVARRQATLSSKITGRLREVLVEEGQQVRQGEIIARLDDADATAVVAQAQARLELERAKLQAAKIALANERPIFERAAEQFENGFLSAQDFDSARARFEALESEYSIALRSVEVAEADLKVAKRNLEDTFVRAPFDGVVTVKAAQEGEIVSPISAGGGFTRTGICTIVDMSSLEVEVDVSEGFINRARVGQAVQVKPNAYPMLTVPAEVVAIVPTADRAKATVKVRIGLKTMDPRILPDMGVAVSFLADENGAPAAVDESGLAGPATLDEAYETGVRTVALGGEKG